MDSKLKFFKIAKELNKKYKQLLEDNEAHIRGNLNSMSLISLNKETPELGFSGIKTEQTIIKKIEQLKNKKLGRPTPEKSLQAWIIKKSLENNYILPFGNNLKFITSEMALFRQSDNKRIVNDILAFDDGVLYIIELKSDRNMKRLKEQVDNFEQIIKENISLFSELCLLNNLQWDEKSIKKVIVWPFSKNARYTFKEVDDKVVEYGYIKNDNLYEFIKNEN